ncbi:sigma 54-interacting transcriptional regulator [Archangium violaceum]|uniref:sigma 54-interacting transcriptional regulator n=1 Tax=Archangium violaceum TaxID=83451 RepID=UPI00193B1AF5|nr:sigma 54-interacting transcriptional regulator [Archangium violaceum]QRK11579.1 sigma 54-interacting transcriptional regulator [Archangium violaceum]
MTAPSEIPSLPRSERKPLYVQVVTQPALHGCWAVNISESGIGLIATPKGPREGPREGEELEMAFTLPDSRARIRVRGVVRWRHDPAERDEGAVTTALGVSFQSFEGSDGVTLKRYLLDHQLYVAVVHAEESELRGLREALESHVRLRFVKSAEDVDTLLGRGDISALLVCGRDEARAIALVERLASRRAEADPSGAGPASDLSPRILYCAPAVPSRLVELFNQGKIFRALTPPFEPVALRQAVLQASRELGLRTEQRRAALELERNLLRERAREAPRLAPGANVADEPGFRSRVMRQVLEMVRVAAPHRVAVLLQGETGTGKEVLARVIHRLSGRSNQPLVVQDCGALTETLLESELFGHVKGAFTGAVADHPGLFVLADGGTIFLDEIENTTPNLQSKLLRVLESGDVRPVGGTQIRRVDVRIIAASNRDLSEEVRAGRFRSDLFYRLNSFTIDLPPLRERPEDVLDLARYFLAHFNRTLRRTALGLSAEAEQLLLAARWPGNVRELRNCMERAVLLCGDGELVTRRHLPPALVGSVDGMRQQARMTGLGSGSGSLRERLEQMEKEIIREALERHGGVVRRAAAALEMDPVTLGRRVRRHGLLTRES